MKGLLKITLTVWIILCMIAFIVLCLTACAPVAKPNAQQSTYQGSPTIIISPECRENCGGNTITTGQTTSTAQTQSDQPITQKTESGMWKLWLIIVAAVVTVAIIKRKKIKEIWNKIIGN